MTGDSGTPIQLLRTSRAYWWAGVSGALSVLIVLLILFAAVTLLLGLELQGLAAASIVTAFSLASVSQFMLVLRLRGELLLDCEQQRRLSREAIFFGPLAVPAIRETLFAAARAHAESCK
jgi:hypothetical protein